MTVRSRRIVFFAQEEALRNAETMVGTEHLLLGLLREEDNLAVELLKKQGIFPAELRQALRSRMKRGETAGCQELQLTRQANHVVQLAFEEARELGVLYIGATHLLVGLARETTGTAGEVLAEFNVSIERLRNDISALDEGATQAGQAPLDLGGDFLQELREALAAAQEFAAKSGRQSELKELLQKELLQAS